jgi:hypothetical protein
MTIYLVELVDTLTHTCAADPEPHVIRQRQEIVATTPGGPCRQPIAIRIGGRTAVIDCARHEPAHKQCPACRTHIVYQHAPRPAA